MIGILPAGLIVAALAYRVARLRGGIPVSVLALHWPRLGVGGWALVIVGFLLGVYGLITMLIAVLGVDLSLYTPGENGASPETGSTGLVKEALFDLANEPLFWVAWPSVIIGAPLAEELIFRGQIFAALAQSRFGRVQERPCSPQPLVAAPCDRTVADDPVHLRDGPRTRLAAHTFRQRVGHDCLSRRVERRLLAGRTRIGADMTLRIRTASRATPGSSSNSSASLPTMRTASTKWLRARSEIDAALFGKTVRTYCDIAEWDGTPVGFALWFYNFSTFKGRNGIYLEDLFVEPDHRGKGIGKALLKHLGAALQREGLPRLQWWVLDWNEPSIAFYKIAWAPPHG